jgi:hypothetical protein
MIFEITLTYTHSIEIIIKINLSENYTFLQNSLLTWLFEIIDIDVCYSIITLYYFTMWRFNSYDFISNKLKKDSPKGG